MDGGKELSRLLLQSGSGLIGSIRPQTRKSRINSLNLDTGGTRLGRGVDGSAAQKNCGHCFSIELCFTFQPV